MTKKIILIIFFVFVSIFINNAFSQTPDWLWAKTALGNNTDVSTGIAVDSVGNTFITGWFSSQTITFGTITLTNSSTCNMFVVKYDPNGNILWAKREGGNGSEGSKSITVDGNGNVYVIGAYTSTNLTIGTYVLPNSNTSYSNVFIIKYDTNGNVIWAKSAGGGKSDYGYNVATDNNGNVYITGCYYSTSITFGTITLNNINSSNTDIFVVKYDPAGSVLWAKSAGGSNLDNATGIAVDDSGNAYISGSFMSSSITFGSEILTNNGPGYNDIFIVKYDSSGNMIWAKSSGGNEDDDGTSITVDGYNNIYVSGGFKSPSIIFDSDTLYSNGFDDIYTVKFDSGGNLLWARNDGGNSQDRCSDITSDINGNAYVFGYFNSSNILFDTTLITNANTLFWDLFIVKYDPAGDVIWAKSIGGSSDEMGNRIIVDGSKNIFVTGSFNSPVLAFGSTSLTNSIGSYTDIFVAKLSGIITSTNETDISNWLNIYPNPFNDYTIIELKNDSKEKFEFYLYNSSGQIVFKNESIISKYTRIYKGFLLNGFYIFELRSNNCILERGKIVIN